MEQGGKEGNGVPTDERRRAAQPPLLGFQGLPDATGDHGFQDIAFGFRVNKDNDLLL